MEAAYNSWIRLHSRERYTSDQKKNKKVSDKEMRNEIVGTSLVARLTLLKLFLFDNERTMK